MHSRWNSQILPRAETAISCAFSFSGLGLFIKTPSSDNIPKKDKKYLLSCEIINNIANYGTNMILLIKGFNCCVPSSAQIRIPPAAS